MGKSLYELGIRKRKPSERLMKLEEKAKINPTLKNVLALTVVQPIDANEMREIRKLALRQDKALQRVIKKIYED